MSHLRHVPVRFPASWLEYQGTIRQTLRVEAGESSEFVSMSALIQMPEAVWLDIEHVVQELSWTPGQVVSYLALRGLETVLSESRAA